MSKVYQVITDTIIEMLEAGVVPWRKQWRDGAGSGAPRNATTNRAYRGLNVWLLAGMSQAKGFETDLWASYKQAQARGWQVRKGEKSTPVIYWHWEPEPKAGEKRDPKKPRCWARYSRVFNLAQMDGCEKYLAKLRKGEEPAPEFEPIEQAAAIVDGWADKPEIHHGGNVACYAPTLDQIRMPKPEQFESRESYYSVLFHELTHSTGHASRLKRDGITSATANFGSHTYGKEELVAEMGAAFLCGAARIEQQTIADSASYIQSWIKTIRGEVKLVAEAGAAAQKAADLILGTAIPEPVSDSADE